MPIVMLHQTDLASSNHCQPVAKQQWFGWPCDPEIEKLRAEFVNKTDPARRKTLGYAISDRVIGQGIYVPVGQARGFGAYRKDRLDGWLRAPVALVWNISKR